MKPSDLNCWKCGESLADVLLPLSRLSKCKHCNADLHVCRMCRFYDTTVNNSCREPIAEKVTDKQRRNFCGYFQPSKTAYQAANTASVDESKKSLDALFDLKSDGNNNASGPSASAEEEARRKLEDLFKPDK